MEEGNGGKYEGRERRGANRLTDLEMERIARRSAEINSGQIRRTVEEAIGDWFSTRVTKPLFKAVASQTFKYLVQGLSLIVAWEVLKRLGVPESFFKFLVG